MNKKLIFTIMCIFMLLVGCSNSIDKAISDESKIQNPTPTLISIKARSKQLTIDIVKELAKKGENLRADDFNEYIGMDIGSGLYIMEYPIDESYSLSVGYSFPDKPEYVLLKKKGTDNAIDIRREDIDEFINEDKHTSQPNFAIYLVENMETFDAIKMDINDLKLEDTPIITDQNILNYKWDSHEITLIKDDTSKKYLDEKIYLKVPVSGKPFVLMCNGERIYVGAFWSALSSLSDPGRPIIMSEFLNENYFRIACYNDNDVRNDIRIYNTMKKLGKLK